MYICTVLKSSKLEALQIGARFKMFHMNICLNTKLASSTPQLPAVATVTIRSYNVWSNKFYPSKQFLEGETDLISEQSLFWGGGEVNWGDRPGPRFLGAPASSVVQALRAPPLHAGAVCCWLCALATCHPLPLHMACTGPAHP